MGIRGGIESCAEEAAQSRRAGEIQHSKRIRPRYKDQRNKSNEHSREEERTRTQGSRRIAKEKKITAIAAVTVARKEHARVLVS